MELEMKLLVRGKGSMAISLEHLAKTYRDSWGRRVVALKDVTLEVEPGEIFGLLGPNGAGKSTTFKILLGLLRSSGGGGTILGHPLGDVAARRRLGYLPENPYFYDYLTPHEFLDTCATLSEAPRKGRRQRIASLLERVGLDPGEKRRLRKFSKGMLQRVGLAQALIHDPELVILDEPMSGLDPVGRRQFRDLITGLRREGKTVVLASHVLPDVEALCDRVGILVDGTLRRTGTVGDLLSSRAHGHELEVSGLPATLEERWVTDGIAHRGGGRLLVSVLDQGTLQDRVQQVFRAGGTLHAVRPAGASLEDVFLSETAGGTEKRDHGPAVTRGAA